MSAVIPIGGGGGGGSGVAKAFSLPFGLYHAEGVVATQWHSRIQLALPSDPTFASPVLSKLTSTSITGWYTHDRRLDVTEPILVAYPAGGFDVDDPTQVRADRIAAIVYYFTQTGDLSGRVAGEPLLLRAAQSDDGGSTWGNWRFLGEVRVGG